MPRNLDVDSDGIQVLRLWIVRLDEQLVWALVRLQRLSTREPRCDLLVRLHREILSQKPAETEQRALRRRDRGIRPVDTLVQGLDIDDVFPVDEGVPGGEVAVLGDCSMGEVSARGEEGKGGEGEGGHTLVPADNVGVRILNHREHLRLAAGLL